MVCIQVTIAILILAQCDVYGRSIMKFNVHV